MHLHVDIQRKFFAAKRFRAHKFHIVGFVQQVIFHLRFAALGKIFYFHFHLFFLGVVVVAVIGEKDSAPFFPVRCRSGVQVFPVYGMLCVLAKFKQIGKGFQRVIGL